MNNSISIIIATKNRPNSLIICLKSILNSTIKPLEIIVVDQSNNQKTKKVVLILNKSLIKYFHLNSKGKSKSLNFAIKKAKGSLLAFTDDDCLVDKKWLENIQNTFKKNQDISLCFGKTLPHQPKKHKYEFCPCTFKKNPDKFSITSEPCKHWERVGFGNNMVIKKKVFKKVGLFKKWLGPGSVGSNAEDAELINRSLINKFRIGYEPSVVIFHNKWLNEHQLRKQEWSYVCGEIACYGWFAFSGFKFAQKIVKDSTKKTLKSLTYRQNVPQHRCRNIWSQITAQLFGLLIAWITYLRKSA